MRKLLSIKSLLVFESAAKHLSFTQAADDLCVTQGAVSRQIKLLEDYFHQLLFVRSTQGLVLTKLGGALYHRADLALDILGRGTHDFIDD